MMTDTNTKTQGINKLYFAAWRWRFYAGLSVIPFLLAIAGFLRRTLSAYWPDTGEMLADLRFVEYSVAAKAMAVGIALHEGQIGLWNFVLNMVFLVLVIFSCVSGLVMWWKRRPNTLRLAAPPKPSDLGLWKGAAVIAVVLSLAFPLIGAVLIGVLALDILVIQNVPVVKRVLS